MVEELKHEYGVDIITQLYSKKKYQAVLLTVSHDEFKSFDFEKYYANGAVVFDTKAVVDRRWVDGRL